MKKSNLATRQLKILDRATRRIRLPLGPLAAAVAALLAMSVATYAIGMSADRPAKSVIRTLSTSLGTRTSRA